MESAETRASQRRSPLDLIMNQIRRKRTAADRKPLGRFLSRDRTGGIPEDGETEGTGDRGQRGQSSGEREGQVIGFKRSGKKSDPRSLSLAHCDLTATDLLELATLLQFLPQLEEVDVSWNDLIGGSLKALTTHLQHVGGIRKLRLCSCRLDADDVTALGDALDCVPLLEILDLSWNSGIGGGALQGLLGGMVSSLPRLTVLDVSCNPQLAQDVDAGGFRALASSLCHAASLTTLRLQACGGSLCCLPALRELDLSSNKGLAGGLNRLTLHLAHLTHLESLDLHLCCLKRPRQEACSTRWSPPFL
ncbi:hypothetical protein FQN60_013467 [Etheostoma spectabile]|uniref:Leucine-rich repeat-containing protein 31 n=1 Tax=Etheostoma spectabile TaxID=54343 RepID=A0A5J5CIR5_9PERO|nr:hypothetical protein FQN60_013467 [Etheostoma spectabile]